MEKRRTSSDILVQAELDQDEKLLYTSDKMTELHSV